MKIVVFAAFYLPYKGGYVESIRQLLERLVKHGHQLLVVTCNTHGQPGQESVNGVEIFRIGCWNPAWLGKSFTIPYPLEIINAWRFLRRRNFDVVSTQTRFFPMTWLGFVFAKVNGLRLIHTERGSRHNVSGNFIVKSVGFVIDYTLGFVVCRFSDVVVGVSEAARDFCRRLGAKSPIKIYNGVDCGFWSLDPGLRGNDNIIITFIGRLVYAKGVQDLIRAASLIRSGLEINVVGEGPYRPDLEKLAKNLNLNNVHFLGERTQKEIRKIFNQTDILANPSYSEGLPRSILEAGAAGLPVIAADAGGTKEIIPSDEYGFIVKKGDVSLIESKIKLLMSDKNLRDKLGNNIRARVSQDFNWEQIVNEYENVLT